MKALYTDGTPVQEGDRVRYHQTPGGLISPPKRFVPGEGWTLWTYGVAAKYPPFQERRDEMLERGVMDPDELHLLTDQGRYLHMAPHVIEKA